MHTVTVQGQSGESRIIVGERLSNLSAYLPARRLIIITDEVVGPLYRDQFPAGGVITIGCGEKNKTISTLSAIYEQLIALEADRSVFIVGVGGGIVGDISGFAASTYMRGVPFGFVATSLLSQVDASVGGKNGVNFEGYKNMVGLFAQPRFVIADISALATLPYEELVCGMAEIIKHGCIADDGYFSYIEDQRDQIVDLDYAVMTRLVHESVKISHGAAVSVGMVMAGEYSRDCGYLDDIVLGRIKRLLVNLNMPVHVDFDPVSVFDALKKDKKRQADTLHFVFIERIGRSLVKSVAVEELGRWLMERPRN
jgi:3-dehydroquinate synthase